MIAFSAVRNLNTDMFAIYGLHDDGSELRCLSSHLGYDCTTPFWSSDGQHLAFTAAERSLAQSAAVYIAEIAPLTIRALTDHLAYHQATIWLSNQQLAVYSNREGKEYLYTINRDGSDMQPLLDMRTYLFDLSWSPDKQQFIVSYRDQPEQFHLLDANGAYIRQLTSDPMPKDQPMWSPDGQYIAFISEDQTTSSLYVMQVDGSERHHVAEIFPVDGRFAWSPDSHQLAYVGLEADGFWAALMIVNRDGTNRRYLARLNTGDESGEIRPSTPVWSADGRQLAYSSFVGDRFELYLTNGEGSNQRCLTAAHAPFALIYDLAWRP